MTNFERGVIKRVKMKQHLCMAHALISLNIYINVICLTYIQVSEGILSLLSQSDVSEVNRSVTCADSLGTMFTMQY